MDSESHQIPKHSKIGGVIKLKVAVFQSINETLSKRKIDKRKIFLTIHKPKLKEITHKQLTYIWFNTPKNKDLLDSFLNQLLNEGIPEKEFDQEIDKEHYRDAGIHEAMQLVDEAILSLNLQNDLHVNILKIISKFKLPELSAYKFLNIPVNDCYLNELMKNSISYRYSNFYFNNYSSQFCSDYIYGIREAVPRCTREINLSYVCFSHSEFSSFIKAAKNAKQIELIYCAIYPNSDFDFGEMIGCKIEFLAMHQSGNDYGSYWTENIKSLFNVFAGINNCECMRSSMIEISLFDHCYSGIIEIKEKIRQNFKNMDHIKLELMN